MAADDMNRGGSARLLLVSGDRRLARGEGGPFGDLLEAFAPAWGRIDVLCPDSPGAAARTLFGNVRLEPVRAGRVLAVLAWMRAARRVLGGERPDLVASHDYGLCAGGLAASRLASAWGVPHVSEIHGVPGLPVARTLRQRLEKAILSVYLRTVGRRAAAVRVVNPELARFARGCGIAPGRVLYLPAIYLDHETYRPADPASEPAYDVVWASRFVPGKGLERTLEALAIVARTRPEVRVALVGDGPLGDLVARRIEALGLAGNVRRLGWLATARELAAVYRAGRVFVLASEHEGGPRAPIEAMACGVPVVVTPVGILPSVVTDGETGFFTDGRPADQADRIERLLGDEPARRRMGLAAAAAARAFERHALVARYAEAYLALARGERPEPAPVPPPRRRRLRVLMLTQVLDEDHPVLGVVPHWVRALALRLDRLDVVPLAAGRFDPPAGVRVRSLGKRPDDPPVCGLARLALLGRFLRTVVPPLARGEVDLVFAHMVPLYAILGSLAGFAFGRRTVLWYAHRSLDAPVRVAHALVAAVATASASSFRLPSRKRRVLGHGVPLAALSASPGPAGEEPMLLSVGRLSPVKDLETLIDAAARLREGPFPDLVLALVGAPPLPGDAGYLDALHERARRLGIAGAVRFVGPVPYEEVPAWTRRAHWIASASRTGSLDKNGLEAIVARRPFFAANESFRPIWGDAAGLFAFEPGDAAGLAARLEAYERLAGPERRALLERLARRVESEHDLEGLADRLVELFRSVAR